MSSRLPRFSRVPNLPSLTLTSRDEQILQHVHRHRFLESTHIVSLVGGSSQGILRRLQLLYHHGYLERPRKQIEYFGKGGTSPIAYGLGNKGVKHLATKFGVPFRHMRWSEKNQAVGRIFLKHALAVSDVMVAIELGVRSHPEIRLLWGDDLTANDPKKRPVSKWTACAKGKASLGVAPDRIFAIEHADENGCLKRIAFFLEVDRGTMPVVRKNFTQTSISRKLLAYEATWKKGLHRSLFGFDRFRVLVVSMSPNRTASIIEACSKLKTGHGLFLFSNQGALKENSDIFSLSWQCVKTGQTATILP